MLSKKINFGFTFKKIYDQYQSQEIILKTCQTVSKVASITLGPKGRNVLIQNQDKHEPRITKDGVTVVKHLQFLNRYEDAVSNLIKKSVDGTNKFAGDGTTSSTIMIGQIVKIAIKKIASGQSIRQIKQGLKIGRQISLDYLQGVSRKIEKQEDLYNVAMVSTNGNKQFSKIISQALWRCQHVNVEKSSKYETYLQYFNGTKIVRGVPHPDFKNVGDKIIYNYPLVITSKLPLQSIKNVIRALQLTKKARKQLVIFAQSINQNIISTLIYNKRKNIMQVCPIQVPSYSQKHANKFQFLQKISKATNSFLFDKYTKSIQNIDYGDFGKAMKIQIDEFQTNIKAKSSTNFTTATIFSGGNTETVQLQNYDKIIDALNSTRNAQKKGIVAGGGLTYWNLSLLLQNYNGQNSIGVKILAQALKSIRKKVFETVNPQLKPLHSEGWVGLNIKSQKMEDMFQAGIVDSVQVCKNVIIDSVSLAGQLIDVKIGVIREKDNKEKINVKDLQRQFKL